MGARGIDADDSTYPAGSMFEQPPHGIDEWRQIPFNGGGDDRVIGVEVPVGQVIAPVGDLPSSGSQQDRFALDRGSHVRPQ